MITLLKNGLTMQVASDVQAAAFTNNGWLIADDTPEGNMNQPEETPVGVSEKEPESPEKKRPVGRRKKA